MALVKSIIIAGLASSNTSTSSESIGARGEFSPFIIDELANFAVSTQSSQGFESTSTVSGEDMFLGISLETLGDRIFNMVYKEYKEEYKAETLR